MINMIRLRLKKRKFQLGERQASDQAILRTSDDFCISRFLVRTNSPKSKREQ